MIQDQKLSERFVIFSIKITFKNFCYPNYYNIGYPKHFLFDNINNTYHFDKRLLTSGFFFSEIV